MSRDPVRQELECATCRLSMAGRLGIYYLRTHTLSRELFSSFSNVIDLSQDSKTLNPPRRILRRCANSLTISANFLTSSANFQSGAQTLEKFVLPSNPSLIPSTPTSMADDAHRQLDHFPFLVEVIRRPVDRSHMDTTGPHSLPWREPNTACTGHYSPTNNI
jgi:hypothetical protein